MSWLARSLANSLKLDDDDDINQDDNNNNQIESQAETTAGGQGGGVKEDLSEITRTFTRQLWGVASFLAPPSSTSPRDTSVSDSSNPESPNSETYADSGKIAGIRSDFAEIGGRFKTGISKLSNHKAVSEISKIASNFLPFGSSDEDSVGGGAVGVTDDVLAFARNIALHPETWLDFPLEDDEDSDDFDMSDAQQEHALAVMNLAPELAALRMELCPEHISDGYFWKIYFVLLHSRLSKHDAEVLSTPQIEEARAMLMYQPKAKLQSEDTKAEEQQSASYNVPTDAAPLETFALEPKSSMEMTDAESVKQPIVIRDVQIINEILVEEPVVKNKDEVIGASKEELVPAKDEAVSTSEKEVVSSKDEKISDSKEVVASRKDEDVSNSKEVGVSSNDEVVSDSKKEVVPKQDKVISSSKEVALQQTDEEDGDDWLEEEEEDSAETKTFSHTPLGDDEDVSFSDLEEDDEETVKSTKKVGELSKNSKNKDSDDWLNVDEKDAI
ncbi:hypothetical protein C5167_037361 [Papaver somniferum]|uniref:BSD domain-containing protein n=1 Tax=Papaver somniferum TaxID=3469 RepID=A0A4Y7IAI8_PAPSO|nr:uncharacterized protein LOC113286416 [Papaver somniferum]RZC44419.1 hypothetical protein C5167_037361 [Papaver somniferum]